MSSLMCNKKNQMTWKPWPGLNLVIVLEERSSDIQMNFHTWAFVLEWIINPNRNSVRTEVVEKSFSFCMPLKR